MTAHSESGSPKDALDDLLAETSRRRAIERRLRIIAFSMGGLALVMAITSITVMNLINCRGELDCHKRDPWLLDAMISMNYVTASIVFAAVPIWAVMLRRSRNTSRMENQIAAEQIRRERNSWTRGARWGSSGGARGGS